MRQGPSRRLTSIKQSFFSRGKDRWPLGGGVEAFKGVYQTIRACQVGTSSCRGESALRILGWSSWH